jgi:outer membrane protein OmpA-like peptidoglycan-associated protein
MKYAILGLACGALLAACASTPPTNPALESARSAVQAAETDPNVSQYAALDLDTARKQLAAAEAAETQRKEPEVNQQAYLAAQNARIAQARASAKADDARVAAGQAERDQIRLAARASEVQRAQLATEMAKSQTDAANQEAARLKAEVDQLKAAATPRGLVLTLGDVLFDTGKAQLNPGADRKLEQLAQFLKDHPDRRVQIDGFTDSVGSDSYNLDLSQRRADAVRSALLGRGIDSSRIGTQGYGKAYPVASNSESGGRQLNRRVEVVIGGENNALITPRS